MEFDFVHIIIGFIALSAVITFLIKKFTKFDTYFLITLIKSKKLIPFFDRLSKHHKLWDAFALLGLIIGFGAVAVDFLYGRKLPKLKRLLLFIGSFSVLSGFLLAFDVLFNNIFSNNLLIGNMFPLLIVSFGLMGLSGFTLFSLLLQATDIVAKYLIGSRSCPGIAP